MKRLLLAILIPVAGLMFVAIQNRSIAEDNNPSPNSAAIQKLINDLGSDSFQVRERATKSLIKAGKPALLAVAAAVSHKDAEVRTRASKILIHSLESANSKTLESVMKTVARSPYQSTARSRALTFLRNREQEKFLGLWEIVSIEQNGKVNRSEEGNQFLFVEKNVFIAKDSPIFGDTQTRNEFTLNPVAGPMTFDCWGRVGIYRRTTDTLKICLSKPTDKTRPKTFVTKDGDGRYVVVLKRFDPFLRESEEFKRQTRAVGSLLHLQAIHVVSTKPVWISVVLSLGLPDFQNPNSFNLSNEKHRWLLRNYGRTSGFDLHRIKNFDSAMPHLKSFSDLQSLKLSSPKVKDRHLKHIRHLEGLERLNLYYSDVTDVGISELTHLTELSVLQLGYTDITDQALFQLKSHKNLRTLDLIGDNITDAGVEHLKSLTNLRRLNLCRTKVTDAGLRHLKDLSNLDHLDLSQTAVTESGVQNLYRSLPFCKIHR